MFTITKFACSHQNNLFVINGYKCCISRQIYCLIYHAMNSRPRIPYISQFIILICLVGFFLLVGGTLILLVTANILNVPLLEVPKALLKPENVTIGRWVQFATAFTSFCLPALVFAVIVARYPLKYLGFNKNVSIKQIGITVLILIAALVLSNSLGELSQHLYLPKGLKQLADNLEKQYMEQVKALAVMNSFPEYLLSIFIIAVLPGVFEEVLFRGCLQNQLTAWSKSPFWAILITSILFSAIHFSIYGFLTRVALSIVLGYLFYFSKNLWLNILFHFLNNGLAITIAYIYIRQGKPIEESIETPMPVWYGVIAIASLILLFRWFITESKSLKPTDTNDYLKKDNNPFALHPQQNLDI